MPGFDGEVSESEVLSMFDKDGDLRDEPQAADEESSDEDQDTEQQDEEENDEDADEQEGDDEEEESEEDEESDEEEPESELNWEAVPPAHRQAYESAQKEVGKLRKDYGKLHSKYAELSQSRREEDQTIQELRAEASTAAEWNQVLEQHPELVDIMVEAVQKLQNPDAAIPDHLREDPVYQALDRQNRALQRQLQQLGVQTKPIQEWKAEQAKAQSRQKLDGLLGEAAKEYKTMFGKDMDEESRTAVLKYMVERKYYESGANAALAVFGPQYKKSLSAKDASRLRDKAAKFGGRNKSVNTRRAASAPKISSQSDAITQALRDQGVDI